MILFESSRAQQYNRSLGGGDIACKHEYPSWVSRVQESVYLLIQMLIADEHTPKATELGTFQDGPAKAGPFAYNLSFSSLFSPSRINRG